MAFTPQSIIAQMLEDLPPPESENFAEEERVSKNIAGIAYACKCTSCSFTIILIGHLAGAHTVNIQHSKLVV